MRLLPLLGGVLLCMAGCAELRPGTSPHRLDEATPGAQTSANLGSSPFLPPQWQHISFPGKTATQFNYALYAGRHSVAAQSVASASMLRQIVRVEPDKLGLVTFAWNVPALLKDADLGLRDHDDSPVRVMLAFEGDRSRLSLKDNMLSELARTLTGEELPYATLMYVWCNSRAPGSVITSPRTDRIRSIVLESGPRRLNQWLDYQRDIRADFETAFGEAPGALVGVAIMSDSDNTRSQAKAWYGAVRMTPTALVQAAKP